MSIIRYKRLVEVRILEEYYLIQANGDSYFSIADPDDQAQFLTDRMVSNQYDTRQDVLIFPDANSKINLKRNKLLFAQTGLGFIIGVEVNEVILGDGTITYQPKAAIDPDLDLKFIIQIKNTQFSNFSNIPLKAPLPANYLFSNADEGGVKTFPSLSLPVEDFAPTTTYEMGTLALVGGSVQEAKTHLQAGALDATNWRAVDGDGFVNNADRKVLPKRFMYKFKADSTALSASFILKKLDGEVVKTIEIAEDDPLRSIWLDFSVKELPPLPEKPEEIKDDYYLLEASDENGPLFTKKILLSSDLFGYNHFGVVEIKQNLANPDFALFEGDGSLKERILPDATKVSHPVFEIRLKSRITYWRFVSNKRKTLNTTLTILEQDVKALKTKEPRSLSRSPTLLQPDDPGTGINETVFLPNPNPADLLEKDERYFSNIYISAVANLITAT